MKKPESVGAVHTHTHTHTHTSNLINLIVRCLIYVSKIIKIVKNENIEEKAMCFSGS